MAVTVDEVRRHALALPGTTEEPHHDFGSFRVHGRIFATVPPGGERLHVMLPDAERDHALALDAEFLEPLPWGRKVLGVRVALPQASASVVQHLLARAHAAKAAKVPTRAKAAKAVKTVKTVKTVKASKAGAPPGNR